MLPKQILQIDTQLKWKKMAFIFEGTNGEVVEIIYSSPLYSSTEKRVFMPFLNVSLHFQLVHRTCKPEGKTVFLVRFLT